MTMKKLLTFIFTLGIVILLALAVNAQHYVGSNNSPFNGPNYDRLVKHLDPKEILAPGLPQKTHGYSWSDAWIWQTYMETSYFQDGNIHVETDFDITTGEPTDRFTYTYDGSGRVIEMFGETNETGSWENAMKYTIAYDSHGNMSEVIANVWTGDQWMIMFGSQMTYTYTTQDWVSSITTKNYDFKNGWQWTDKEIYALNGSGYPTQVLYQDYNGGWVDSERWVDLVWHEYIPEIGYGTTESYIQELWNGADWIPDFRELTDYDANGGYVMTHQIYTGGWVNSYRETMTMENNYPKLYKYEDWIDGAWVQTSGDKYIYTFLGENLTEEIIQTYDQGLLNYVNWSKYVYSDFFYTTGQDELHAGTTFIAYPNPVTSEITIQMQGDISSGCLVEIMNLTGQVVFSERMDLSASKLAILEVSSLPDGLYILQASTDGKLFTKKFLKK